MDGAHDEDRTRLRLLDREVTSPDADVRNEFRAIAAGERAVCLVTGLTLAAPRTGAPR
jgi:hypothetical protein